MVPVLGALHPDVVGDSGFRQGDFAGRDGVLKAGGYGSREFFGSHPSSLPGARELEELRLVYVDILDTAPVHELLASLTD